jgi:ribonucleoside-diphosphate reductase alpha chain
MEMETQVQGVAMSTARGKTSNNPHNVERARENAQRRLFTRAGQNPLDQVSYKLVDSVIAEPDGTAVFEMKGIEVPEQWSQLAADIAASKYFRKAGINGDPNRGERSVRELIYRVAHTIREAGEQFGGYFNSAEDADTFEAELSYVLVHQRAAFNSPVWFNCGLSQRYGITGGGGNYVWERETDSIVETRDAYRSPQCSACFIQKVDDDLMSIYELIKNEARLFKYGSGTGTNFSPIRGSQEKLSGGGTSSGLMSFLEVFDRAAGATKSGGTTRRAAKMVCLDMDHPEIVNFIKWKTKEEKKANALMAAGYGSDFNQEAYHTVSGQNSNNSVRVTDAFMRAVESDGDWRTYFRTTSRVCDTYRARDLWRMIAESAWACADPGVQFDTTINEWHTCPTSGRINASNPCSEYMFIDDSACNLGSINLSKYLDDDGRINVDALRHTVRLMVLAQDILVDYSSYPTKQIARNSHDYRALGLGYANLGTVLMRLGIAYDSAQGRGICSALTAILSGEAYRTSAEIAASKGPFTQFGPNRQSMLRVIGKHRDAASHIADLAGGYSQASRPPEELLEAARRCWDEAFALGERHGYRNAQTTVLAPTGTIGLLMDCDTTGIEPDFALVKFKKLAGGGYFKIVNQTVPAALRRMGYSEAQTADIVTYITGTNTFAGAPHASRKWLLEKGLTAYEIEKAEAALPSAFDVGQVFLPQVIGGAAYQRLQISSDDLKKPGFHLLRKLGLTRAQIDQTNDFVIGRMTIEGAPHLREEHLPVFDCASRCGKTGKRFLPPMAHLRMMAAAQPFLSGAISKTVNLPNEATVEDIADTYLQAWKLGLKAVALYRDGCKSSQPLSTSDSEANRAAAGAQSEVEKALVTSPSTPVPFVEGATPPPSIRHRLPRKRTGFTQEARVGGNKIFLRTGEYSDGSLGEIFIDMHKEGAAFRSLMNCFAISVSMGLQYGVPLASYVDQFTFTRFEPQGPVEGHPNVKFATSIIDYIFRVLGIEYLKRYELAHKPPEEVQTEIGKATDVNSGKQAEQAMQQRAGAQPPPQDIPTRQVELFETFSAGNVLDQSLGDMMRDAPMCDQCGHITVRNGACYKCLNCGNSMGCS